MTVQTEKRTVNYLRISVTDLCNLRCVYCMPPGGVEKIRHEEILSFEEIIRVVKAALGIGITRFRITGGEPLVRKGILRLVEKMGKIEDIEDFSMTTNGLLLDPLAPSLRKAGIQRLNISLDSLTPETYRRITRGGDIALVLKGIEAARRAGFNEVKLNTVILKGINEGEIFSLLDFAREKKLAVRFIEMMPISAELIEGESRFLSLDEIKRRIEEKLPLEFVKSYPGCGPAEYYQTADKTLTIGFIAPISHNVCRFCNRLRLTAEGKLRPCLASDWELDLRRIVRGGGNEEDIQEVLREGIEGKPEAHKFGRKKEFKRKMVAIGG